MPTAVITGGTTGIGRATAELLHTRGYRVAVTGQKPESVARARSELPGDVLVVRSDGRVLSDTDALMSAVSAVSARFGSLDLLFLNAGIFRPAPVAEVPAAAPLAPGWGRRPVARCRPCCPPSRSNWPRAGFASTP